MSFSGLRLPSKILRLPCTIYGNVNVFIYAKERWFGNLNI